MTHLKNSPRHKPNTCEVQPTPRSLLVQLVRIWRRVVVLPPRTCMCVLVHVCVCVLPCMCVFMLVCACVCVHMFLGVCACVCKCVLVCVRAYILGRVCLCTCACVYALVCMCVYVCLCVTHVHMCARNGAEQEGERLRFSPLTCPLSCLCPHK